MIVSDIDIMQYILILPEGLSVINETENKLILCGQNKILLCGHTFSHGQLTEETGSSLSTT